MLEHISEEKQFGIIVGLTGTGKSAIVRNMCYRFPEGVIYCEVNEPRSFVQDFAEEINLKIVPSNVFDITLEKYSSKYTMYYPLEEDPIVVFGKIVRVLKQAATRFW